MFTNGMLLPPSLSLLPIYLPIANTNTNRSTDLYYSECLTVGVEYDYSNAYYEIYYCDSVSGYMTAYPSFTDGIAGETFVLPEPVTVTRTMLTAGGDTYVYNVPTIINNNGGTNGSDDGDGSGGGGGLTMEAKIGIGVGVPSAVIALVTLLTMWWKRR